MLLLFSDGFITQGNRSFMEYRSVSASRPLDSTSQTSNQICWTGSPGGEAGFLLGAFDWSLSRLEWPSENNRHKSLHGCEPTRHLHTSGVQSEQTAISEDEAPSGLSPTFCLLLLFFTQRPPAAPVSSPCTVTVKPSAVLSGA